VSGGPRTWLVSLAGSAGILGVPLSAQASHPAPGSEVPWMLLLVAAVLIFVAAWVLTVFFDRRQKRRSTTPESREPLR
jgi:membrane protein implicated in regulation of membrane protease activity